MSAREVLFEFRRIGTTVKVSVVDVHSNTEVSLVGDMRAGEAALKQAALRRLEYVLAKKGAGTG